MNYKSNGEVILIMEKKIVIQNFGPVKEAQINRSSRYIIPSTMKTVYEAP